MWKQRFNRVLFTFISIVTFAAQSRSPLKGLFTLAVLLKRLVFLFNIVSMEMARFFTEWVSTHSVRFLARHHWYNVKQKRAALIKRQVWTDHKCACVIKRGGTFNTDYPHPADIPFCDKLDVTCFQLQINFL